MRAPASPPAWSTDPAPALSPAAAEDPRTGSGGMRAGRLDQVYVDARVAEGGDGLGRGRVVGAGSVPLLLAVLSAVCVALALACRAP